MVGELFEFPRPGMWPKGKSVSILIVGLVGWALFACNLGFSLRLILAHTGRHRRGTEPRSNRGLLGPPPGGSELKSITINGLVFKSEHVDVATPRFDRQHTSSDPDFASNQVIPSLSFRRRVFQTSPLSLDIYVDLPPFYWALPLGLNSTTTALFWRQPENHRHFNDSVQWSSGKVQVFFNSTLVDGFHTMHNATHYFNYNRPITVPGGSAEHDVVMLVMGHMIELFQHFLDNGVPHITLMELATGIDPSRVTFIIENWLSDSIPNLLRRYGYTHIIKRGTVMGNISARVIVLAEIVPVVHPVLIQRFLDRIHLNHKAQTDKIVLVSRQGSSSSKPTRLILNQDHLERSLRQKFGSRVELFRSDTKFDTAVEQFERAAVVIGSHGGAMYNALWASRACQIVEILPLLKGGGYPDQGDPTAELQFAHLAFHTISMMNYQRYYRYYTFAGDINYNVDIPHFLNWLQQFVLG
jgi:hypothetical protein